MTTEEVPSTGVKRLFGIGCGAPAFRNLGANLQAALGPNPAKMIRQPMRQMGLCSNNCEVHPSHPSYSALSVDPAPATPRSNLARRCARRSTHWLGASPPQVAAAAGASVLLTILLIGGLWAWLRSWLAGELLPLQGPGDRRSRQHMARDGFRTVSNGSCASVGWYPIIEQDTCRSVANDLHLNLRSDKVSTTDGSNGLGEGCYYSPVSAVGNRMLMLRAAGNESAATQEGGYSSKLLQPICVMPAFWGPVMDGVRFDTADVASLANISNTAACCGACQEHPSCRAWTWGKNDTCYLKASRPNETLPGEAVKNSAFVSGFPFRVTEPPGSLFCFALMLPWSYEGTLLALQHRENTSIFACAEYAIYSNLTLEVVPGVWTYVVNHSLVAPIGGEFRTALNTEIFIAVWKKVLRDARFRLHDWTVKVDPDTVFLPERLRDILRSHTREGGDPENGVYLNNCRMGMHGPLEVFSRNAVARWGDGIARCVRHFTKLCSGPCLWGEDLFVDQCMSKVLGSQRDDAWSVLVEAHCDPSPGWMSCQNESAAAFHPFKSTHSYHQCLVNATFSANHAERDDLQSNASLGSTG